MVCTPVKDRTPDETLPHHATDTKPVWHLIAVLISLVLHILPFPAYLLGGMLHWFGPPIEDLPDHATIIPIDLLLAEGEAPAEESGSAPEVTILEEHTGGMPVVKAKPPDKDAGPTVADAGDDAVVDASTGASSDAALEASASADLDAQAMDNSDGGLGDAADVVIDTDASVDDASRVAELGSDMDAGLESGLDTALDDVGGPETEPEPEAGPKTPNPPIAAADSGTSDREVTEDAAPTSADASIDAPRDSSRDASRSIDGGGAYSGRDGGVVGVKDAEGEPTRDAGGDAAQDSGAHQPIRDPIGLSGDGVRQVAPRDPNVSLLVNPVRFRSHPLAIQFAPSLTKLQNWRNFFGNTDLDPIRDTDRILIAGPQFRDTSRVVAVVQYNVTQQRVRTAVDAVVRQSGDRGRWEKRAVPVAKAHVDGAERYFVMPSPKILVVVPPDGLDQAVGLKARFPEGAQEAVVLFLKYPANALRGMPLRLPTSVEWMRFSLTMNPAGGADGRLEAKDRDAETAAKNAPLLTDMVNKAVEVNLLLVKRRYLDHVTFRADGDRLRTEFHITNTQLKQILSAITAHLESMEAQASRQKTTAVPPASASTATSATAQPTTSPPASAGTSPRLRTVPPSSAPSSTPSPTHKAPASSRRIPLRPANSSNHK